MQEDISKYMEQRVNKINNKIDGMKEGMKEEMNNQLLETKDDMSYTNRNTQMLRSDINMWMSDMDCKFLNITKEIKDQIGCNKKEIDLKIKNILQTATNKLQQKIQEDILLAITTIKENLNSHAEYISELQDKYESLQQLTKNHITNWQEFANAFEEKYWSHEVQQGIKQKLEVEKYKINRPMSRSEYFIKRVLMQSMTTP